MNALAAYAVPVPLGFHAMCRFSHNARPWPIMEAGKPKVFTVRTDAVIAAQQHVIDHINGTMQRSGERLPTAVSEAEKQWGAIYIKGREIKIERKERAKV